MEKNYIIAELVDFCLLLELHEKGSAPAACAARLFFLAQLVTVLTPDTLITSVTRCGQTFRDLHTLLNTFLDLLVNITN